MAQPFRARAEQRNADAGGDRLLLLLTGWTDYAFSSDNVAAAQAGLALQPPSLQVRDAAGEWSTVIEEIGVPVGRPQTVVVDLTGRFLSASREVRVVTSMRVYWDEARVATGAMVTPDPTAASFDARVPAGPIVVRRHDPERADLAWRGFSAEVSTVSLQPTAYRLQAPPARVPGSTLGESRGTIVFPPVGRPFRAGALLPVEDSTGSGAANSTGAAPPTYDYDRVSTVSPWKEMPGRYTREGDVKALIAAIDDLFVVSRPGDAIAVAFPAEDGTDSPNPALTSVGDVEQRFSAVRRPHGTGLKTRATSAQLTFFLFAHGYSKEMDINSASPDQAAPLPFRGMTRYPYEAPEAYPSTPAHRGYLERDNTRVVRRSLPPL